MKNSSSLVTMGPNAGVLKSVASKNGSIKNIVSKQQKLLRNQIFKNVGSREGSQQRQMWTLN